MLCHPLNHGRVHCSHLAQAPTEHQLLQGLRRCRVFRELEARRDGFEPRKVLAALSKSDCSMHLLLSFHSSVEILSPPHLLLFFFSSAERTSFFCQVLLRG